MDAPIASIEEKFVSMIFGEYYENNFEKMWMPERFIEREFGFGTWGKKIAFRHFAFKNPNELKQYLLRNTPFFVSYSTAYYEYPDGRPMEKKNWLGAELVFDLDHVPGLQCNHRNDWICDKCLEAIKTETIRLMDEFLVPDFGVSKSEMMINFSGGKGYHIHIKNKLFEELNASQRKELVAYIMGLGIEKEKLGFKVIEKRWHGPKNINSGWSNKLKNKIKEIFDSDELIEKLKQKDLSNAAYKIFSNKENRLKIIKGIDSNNWDIVPVPAPEKNWGAVIDLAKEMAMVNIDASMTCDAKKLARLPDSIHGGTGFRACVVNNIEKFDPLRNATVDWEGTARVAIEKSDEIRIGDTTYGPYENKTLELPMNVAVFFLCKGVGKCPDSTK